MAVDGAGTDRVKETRKGWHVSQAKSGSKGVRLTASDASERWSEWETLTDDEQVSAA